MSNESRYSLEQIVGMCQPESPVLSPDGNYIAYVRGEASKSESHPVGDIWLLDVERESETPLTSGESQDSTPCWSPCGSFLTFTSDRAERGTSQVYVMSVVGGEPVQLTYGDGPAFGPRWSPDGTMIACLINETESQEEQKRKDLNGDQWIVDDEPKRSHIWVIQLPDDLSTLLSGEVKPALRRINPRDIHVGTMLGPLYDWAPDSRGFAAHIAESPKVDHLWFAEVTTISLEGEVRRLGTFPGLFTPPRFSPDGTKIAFIGSGDVAPMAIGVPYVVPVAGGEPRPLALSARGSATAVTWDPRSGRLLVNLVKSLQSDLYSVSVEDDSDEPFVSTCAKPGTIGSIPSLSPDGGRITFLRTDSASPLEVWYGESGGDVRPVTDLNPWTREQPVGDVRELTWKSTDGCEVHGLLYLPVGYQEGETYPLLAHIHGGPMGAWTHRFYCSWHDWALPMTQRGYAVFMPNPRGSSGRGPAYLGANHDDLGGLEWTDIDTGIDECIRMGIADPDRLFIGGWSYGGYFTNWAITHSDRFKAAVSGASISNWVSFNGTTDVRRIFDAYFAEPVNECADGQWERSPVRYLNRVTTPTLFVHGDADIRVPISQSYEMYYGVKDRGVDTQMVVYPREPHGISERKHQADMLRRVFEWYERYNMHAD